MRNLKRALSLAVASVMLLGLMVVGTGAVSVNDFGDADQIASENLEAATITTGLGLFAGADGNFLPDEPVTRAQMATIICKMLYGNDVNANNFKGVGTFQDTANFESGWAEGYINMCASLGIVSGYNETAYGPGDTVTTWQAALMLQRALGYWNTASSEPINELTVTALATQLGFFGDLTLSANEPLAREDVAVMAFNALFAQRVAYDDYRGLYVKANDRNVVVTNGTEDASNTLAQNTFGLYITEGVVVANGATDERLSPSLRSESQTRVVFTEDTDLNQDGKFEYAEGEDYDFEVGSGLDMIGHAVNIYYTIERNAPVVYAMVDDATLVGHVEYDSNTTRLANAANDLGFKKNTILDITSNDYIVNYDFDTTVGDLAGTSEAVSLADRDLILISNSGNYNVDYVIVLDQYLDVVEEINTDEDIAEFTLETAQGDLNVALTDVSEGDYVIVTDIGKQGEVLAFQSATVFNAGISKLTGQTGTGNITKVTADGEDYFESMVYANNGANQLENVVDFSHIETIGEATMVLDQFGKLIAILEEPSLPNYAYVAEYGVRHSTGSLNTTNVLTAKVYFADGTNGVYEVDLAHSNALVYGGGYNNVTNDILQDDANVENLKSYLNGHKKDASSGSWIVDKATLGGQLDSKDIYAARGLYDVTLDGDEVEIDVIQTPVSSDVDDSGIRLVKSHSTLLQSNANVKTTQTIDSTTPDKMYKDGVLYQNNNTVYFYVSYDGDLSVSVITGIKNTVGFTNGQNEYDAAKAANTGIAEAFASLSGERAVVDVMLITNVDLGNNRDVYYHDVEDYTITDATGDGDYQITYKVYDNETGEMGEVTYDNGGDYWGTVSAAKNHADGKEDGWYTLGEDDLNPYAAVSPSADAYISATKGNVTYVTNDSADYDEYADNLFGHNSDLGVIVDDASLIIVDVCDSGLTTVNRLTNAIEDVNATGAGTLHISFSWNEDYETFVIFVTKYDPDATEAPGGGDTTLDVWLESVSVNGIEQSIPGVYKTAAEAVANAKQIKLPHNTTTDLDIDLTSKVNPASGTITYYGYAKIYEDYEAARDADLHYDDAATAGELATATGTALGSANPAAGNYLLITIADTINGELVETYYAYTFVE